MLKSQSMVVLCLATLAVLSISEPMRAGIGGKERLSTIYRGRAGPSDDPEAYLVKVVIEDAPFLLSSVANKYRLVRFYVANQSGRSLTLSAREDTIRCMVGQDVTVTAILDLQTAAPDFVAALTANMRDKVAYPSIVEDGESEYFYVFFPKDKISTLPASFDWRIDSLQKTVSVKTEPVMER